MRNTISSRSQNPADKPVQTARKLASQLWGEVQHQRKLAEGIWMFDCSGHGGIITDINVRPETGFRKTFVYAYKGRIQGWAAEQHYAAFEEDCDAAMVEWMYASEIITEKYMSHFVNEKGLSFSEWKSERIGILFESIARWNPNFLKTCPAPDIRTYK